MVNEQVLRGNWNEIKGKLNKRWGQLSGDELQGALGNVDQLVGLIQRKTGEARGEVERYLEELTSQGSSAAAQATESVRQYAHQTAESIQESTHQAAEHVRQGYAEAERIVRERPFESLAVCFGVGLISGVVIGLFMRSR